ncbi:MAG TPA: K(+)-transporting ATPase subunit C [Thermoleophilaceae bacterium]|jgi:potassium-transporting ATPase KdpC subunit|nr:K(+)-transporting ATPase subunit C [Thermoleophilaceae bacterium]
MRKDLTASITAIIVFTLLLGLAYPLLTTGVAQVLFPNKADGSQVELGGEVVGSRLIGQDFKRPVMRNGEPVEDEEGEPVLEADPAFFQSRPSVTSYNPAGTFFNNLGPNNKELADLFEENLTAYLELERRFNPGLQRGDVPVDAVTTSASGVDPHISEANAELQARRVAEERGLELEQVQGLIDEHTDDRGLGVLGEPGVNVLELNLALDGMERSQ